MVETRGLGARHRNPEFHEDLCNAANFKLAVAEQFVDRARANYKKALRDGRRYYIESTARTMRIEEANEGRLRRERDAVCAEHCAPVTS